MTLALAAALGLALGASPATDTLESAPLAARAAPALGERAPLPFGLTLRQVGDAPERGALRQDEGEYPPSYDDEGDENRKRFFLAGWAGEAFGNGGSGRSSSIFGGEVSIAFSAIDVGIATYGYRSLEQADDREWTPVTMLRLTERFRTGRGVEATFGFGAGAGRTDRWHPWFQVALGMRVPLGPIFLGGELAFEQYSLLRLAAALGLAF